MRSGIDAETLALQADGLFSDHWRLRVANGSGTMVDLSDRIVSGSLIPPSPAQTVGSVSLELLRELNDDPTTSLSPTVAASLLNRLDDGTTYDRLLQLGRAVTLDVAYVDLGAARPEDGSALWYEVLRGTVVEVGWPTWDGGRVTLQAEDEAGRLQDEEPESSEVYPAGTPIEDKMQQVLDRRYGTGAYTLAVPVASGAVQQSDYEPGPQRRIWQIATENAQSLGWVCWYRYTGNTAAPTLFEPDRAKSAADFTLARVRDWTALKVNKQELANVVYVKYVDENRVVQVTPAIEDAESIATYGGERRVGWIALDESSPVRTEAAALALGQKALSDMAHPDVIGEISTPLFVFGECAVDLYTVPADGRFFDSAQKVAPFQMVHEFGAGRISGTRMQVRDRPSAGHGSWDAIDRNPTDDPATLLLHDFRVLREDDDTITFGWTLGARLEESWYAARLVDAEYSTDQWAGLSNEVQPLPDGVTEVTVAKPPEGRIRLVQVEGRYEASAGVWKAGGLWRREVYPKVRVPALDPETGELADAAVQRAEQVADGVLTARTMTESARRFSTSVAFSAPDHETVAWTAGVVTLADGTTYHVDSGATGAMTAPTFIYLDPGLSTTALRVTTNVAEAVGERRLLLCYARPIADATQQAMFVPAVGLLGLNSETLNVNSVNAIHIASISLAVLQAQVNQLSALTADLGEVNTGIINNAAEAPTRGIRLGDENALPATWVDFLDLAAEGTDPVLKVGGMQVLADGTTAVLDPVPKKLRISHHGFRPSDDTTPYSAAINNTNLASGTGTSGDFFAPLPIPAGVVITGIRFRGSRGDASNLCQAVLYRQNADDTNTALATATVSTNADQTALGTVFPSEVASEDVTYLIEVFLSYAAGAAPGFRWVEVQYTSPNYRATY